MLGAPTQQRVEEGTDTASVFDDIPQSREQLGSNCAPPATARHAVTAKLLTTGHFATGSATALNKLRGKA